MLSLAIPTGIGILFMIYHVLTTPLSLEKANEKRIAKNKSTLSEEEFNQRVKMDRIVGVTILILSYIASLLLYTFLTK